MSTSPFVVERALRAVAVMHVPVDDRDARVRARAGGARPRRRCRRCRSPCRSRPARGGRAGARARRRWRSRPVEHGIDGGEHAARGEQRDLVRARPERRQPAGVAAVVVRERLDALDVGALVEAADLVHRGHARLDGAQLRRHPGDVEQVLEAALGERVLGVDVGLDPAAGRERTARVPRVVPHVALVPDQSGRHARLSFALQGVCGKRRVPP